MNAQTAPKKRGRPRKEILKEENFCAHLEKIKSASAHTKKLIEKSLNEGKTAQASIAAAWELVFDFFCSQKSASFELSELNTLSGIIHKLVASDLAVRSGELKFSEKKSKGGLSESGLKEIEEKLKLL